MTHDGRGAEKSMRALVTRRQALRLAGAGTVLLLAACGPGPVPAAAPPAATPQASAPPASTTGGANAAPSVVAQASPQAGWDQMVAAAQKEGKVVVSGPPSDEARKNLPAAFKQKFGIDVEYLGGNSSQLASRIQSERTAGQYTIDVSLSGTDTMYGTFLANKWLDPLKPALLLPEVVDPAVWPMGGPWFRDPGGDTILQIFNNISPMGYVNTSLVPLDQLKTADDLLDPKFKGKIAAYSPAVNGAGLVAGSVLYVSKGEDFVQRLYKGQEVALTRDYQQLGDWVAHGSYPIGLAATYAYVLPFKDAVPIEELDLPDVKTAVAGGFGMVGVWNQAPHPNAAKVFANWIASKDGSTLYGQGDGSAPVRRDVDASTWLPQSLIPQPGGDYLDTYDYDFVTSKRQQISRFYASILG